MIRRMTYDCFNFYNEFDLLDIRLNELWDIVDYFVLVESTVTFTNRPKPLFFKNNKNKYKKYSNKIIHIVVDDSPDVSNPWIIEHYQLAAVERGLKNAKLNDTILISCVDEIPNKKIVNKWKNMPGRHKAFLQNISYYYLNYFAINYGDGYWEGSRMFRYRDLRRFQDPYVARFTKPDVKIPNGGWHFSYVGGIRAIQKKLEAFSHQEFNNNEYKNEEHLLKSIMQGKDFQNTGLKFKVVDLKLLPEYVANNKEKFKNLLVDNQKLNSAVNVIELNYWSLKNMLRKIKKKLLKEKKKIY